MQIMISKSSISKELKLNDEIPFSEEGKHLGYGKVIDLTDKSYIVELDDKVTKRWFELTEPDKRSYLISVF
jgi:hypothetical protein